MPSHLRPFQIHENMDRLIPSEAYSWRIYATSGAAAMAATMIGYETAFIGGAITLSSFRADFHLDDDKTSVTSTIMSVLIAGGLVGSIFAYFLTEWIGRRYMFVYIALLTMIGSVLQVASDGQLTIMYAGRAVSGLGIGAAAMVVPVYLAECAPHTIRGRLMGISELAFMIATVVGCWVNYGVEVNVEPSSKQWRIPFGVQLVPCGMLIASVWFIVESPRWLVKTGRGDEALKALSWLRNLPTEHDYMQLEYKEMMAQIDEQDGSGSATIRTMWKELTAKGMRRRMVLCIGTKIMHTMTGMSALALYSPLIFHNIGFRERRQALLLTGIFGIVKVITTAIFLLFLIDTWGRRGTLLAGSIIIVATQFYLGGYSHVSRSFDHSAPKDAGAYMALVSLMLFTAANSFSWAWFPYVFTSEIFPTRLRSFAVTIINVVQWLMHFGIAYAVPYMVKNIKEGLFFLFGGATLMSTILVFCFYPETKGFPLEKVGSIFDGSYWARTSRRDAEKALREDLEADKAGGESVESVNVEMADVKVGSNDKE